MRAKRCDTPRPGCCPAHEMPEPDGCRWCGAHYRDHGTRTVAPPIGAHLWAEPTAYQRELRSRYHTD